MIFNFIIIIIIILKNCSTSIFNFNMRTFVEKFQNYDVLTSIKNRMFDPVISTLSISNKKMIKPPQ